MKKNVILVMALFSMVFNSIQPTFCETETDPYTGEPIEWADDTADGECGIEDETYAIEGLEPPTMSSSEAADAESIVQSMDETKVQYDTAATGTVQLVCALPDDFPGYTIEAIFYDDNFKRTILYCYEKNGYTAMTELPAGHYMLGAIYVPNDIQDKYPLVTDCKNFDLADHQQVTITAELAKNYISTPTIAETDKHKATASEAASKTDTASTVGLVLTILGIGLLGFLIGKKMIAKNRFE